MVELVEIGWMGKAHGLKGEIKARVAEFYEEDLFKADSLHIGDPAVPYFIESIRAGGAIILKLENFDDRAAVSLLSGKPLYLMQQQVRDTEAEVGTVFDALIGYSIEAEGYPRLGPITGIMDLPEHYLAELQHDGKEVLIPLHENLILGVEEEGQILRMALPDGLIDG